MTTELDTLVAGWKRHFAAADSSITWRHAERPLHTWLTSELLLVGVVDADGLDGQGQPFFGEWKTASPREKRTWKQVWRKNPQSLTYGVLMESAEPACRTFTVRKAFKEAIPTYDFAWYSYSAEELASWRSELCTIAAEIRDYGREAAAHWPTNFGHCFRYGPQYECPFFAQGCDKQKWDFVPASALKHTPIEELTIGPTKTALAEYPSRINGDLVVLSPTRIEQWLGCRERFRKHYIEGIKMPSNAAQDMGKNFHTVLGAYYGGLICSSAATS